MLRLKIQRLRGEDFFVSIGGKDLVTQLKEQVLQILKTGDASEVWAEVTNLRLIYKGKVLVDAKSIEFYKIQNDDTIQLVPFRRRRNTSRSSSSDQAPAPSPSGGGTERSQPELGGSRRQPAGRGPIRFLSLSTSVVGGLPSFISGRPQRVNTQQPRQVNSSQIQSNDAPSPLGLPARPITSRSLRRFKEQLQSTFRRVRTVERRGCREGGRELASQLSGLIRAANSLKTQLLEQARIERPSVFAATAEEGVFSVVESKEDNERETTSVSGDMRGAIVPFLGGSTSTAASPVLRPPRGVAARLTAMNILAIRDAVRQRHQGPGQRGPRRRGFTSQRPVRRQTAIRGRGRNFRNGVVRAVVVSPINGLDTPLRPLLGIRLSEIPRSEQTTPERSSGDGTTDSSSIARRADSGVRSSRLRRWTTSENRSDDVLIEFIDRFINGRQ